MDVDGEPSGGPVKAEFSIHYTASCTKCGWLFEHKYAEQAYPKPETR